MGSLRRELGKWLRSEERDYDGFVRRFAESRVTTGRRSSNLIEQGTNQILPLTGASRPRPRTDEGCGAGTIVPAPSPCGGRGRTQLWGRRVPRRGRPGTSRRRGPAVAGNPRQRVVASARSWWRCWLRPGVGEEEAAPASRQRRREPLPEPLPLAFGPPRRPGRRRLAARRVVRWGPRARGDARADKSPRRPRRRSGTWDRSDLPSPEVSDEAPGGLRALVGKERGPSGVPSSRSGGWTRTTDSAIMSRLLCP
jgi:hypothetical protein